MLKLQVPGAKVLLIVASLAAAALSAAFVMVRAPATIRFALPERSTWWIAPTMLASKWNLFSEARVAINKEYWPTGKRALQALFEDRADIAYVAAPPILQASFDDKRLVVVAQAMSSNRIVHLLRQNDHATDWLNYPIGLARHTISEFYLIAYLKKIGKLDLYRDGKLQLIDRPNVEGNFISLIEQSTRAILLFEPFASIVNRGDPALRKFSEISDPPNYRVVCYIVTTVEKWRTNRAGIVAALSAIRRASNMIKRDPQKAKDDVRPLLQYAEQSPSWSGSDWQSVDFSLITKKTTVRESLSQDSAIGTEGGIFPTMPNFEGLLSIIDDVDSALIAEGL